MTINYNNIYLKEVSSVAGLLEKEGNFGELYDKTYDNYYIGEKTFEQAEIKMIKESINIVLTKSKLQSEKIDVLLSSDLLNQLTPSNYASDELKIPFIGIYNACASMGSQYILGSSLLQNKNVNNVLLNLSSHNMTAERQYRNPVEYGCPRPKRSTYTVTGSASAILTKEKTDIKLTSVTIGKTTNIGITDVYDMGSVMSPSACETIYEHLKNTNTKVDDYDLILTGDLGVYGKEILTEYMKQKYNIDLKNKLLDAGSIIYNREKQESKVNAGGSGPACLALVFNTHVIKLMQEKSIKKVLLVPTGALFSPTMNNQKLPIPSISHAICLEVVK